MKKLAAFAALVVFAAASLGAAVWDGSAVTGVAGDFPGDGLYGECNSFPRDTTVTLTNLENGRSVAITITDGIDNPGVFIALSPKAAAQLDMKPGSAARVRATALTASQAEATLPPVRAGETSDPDYNPKLFVERAKAAEKSAAGNQATGNQLPLAAAAPVPVAPSAEAPQPVPPAPQVAQVPAGPAAAPPASSPASAATAAPEVSPTPAAVLGPDYAQPIASNSSGNYQFQGRARPSALSAPLPAPELPASQAASAPPAPTPAQEPAPPPALAEPSAAPPAPQPPEVIADSSPRPKIASAPRLSMADPQPPEPTQTSNSVPEPAAEPAPPPAQSDKAVVDALARPGLVPGAASVALAEPQQSFAPEELPEAVLDRVTAPSRITPSPALADAQPPEGAEKEGAPEALALERPSYARQVEELALQESTPPSPSESFADRKAGAPEAAQAELQNPEAPSPSESLADEKPAPVVSEGEDKPGKAASAPSAELAAPAVPSPTESISAEKPQAEPEGEQVVTLEPAEPRPPTAAAPAMAPAVAPTPAPAALPPAAIATITEKPAAGGLEVPSSIPVLKGLTKGSYYVQVGVFSTNDSLSTALKAFTPSYPLAVESITTKSGAMAYRLFVGPLTRDESGVVLVRMRSLGFKDAYIRQGS